MRHKYVCIGECGVVVKNIDENELFSAVKIVDNALQQWYKCSTNQEELHIDDFPMNRKRQDIYTFQETKS